MTCEECGDTGEIEDNTIGALGYVVKKACPRGCAIRSNEAPSDVENNPEYLFSPSATYDGSTVIGRLRKWVADRVPRPDGAPARTECTCCHRWVPAPVALRVAGIHWLCEPCAQEWRRHGWNHVARWTTTSLGLEGEDMSEVVKACSHGIAPDGAPPRVEESELFRQIAKHYSMHEIPEVVAQDLHRLIAWGRADVEAERDAYRAMCADFVACMIPHPVEHPTMHATWTKGKALLKNGPEIQRRERATLEGQTEKTVKDEERPP